MDTMWPKCTNLFASDNYLLLYNMQHVSSAPHIMEGRELIPMKGRLRTFQW